MQIIPGPPERDGWRSESVFVATPHRAEVAASYTISLLALFAHDMQTTGMVARGGGPCLFPANPMNLPEIRNKLAGVMLDQTEADWLLCLDSDAGFEPDLAERLVMAADPVERPILGALAFFAEKRESDRMGGFIWAPAPTIYDWGGPDGQPGFFHRWEYPENTVIRCGATGAHALLIHRSVLEKLRVDGDTWFTRVMLDPTQGVLGEDFSFCARAARAGFPVHVHTGVQTSHLVTVTLIEQHYQSALMVSRLSAIARREESGETSEPERSESDA